MSEAWLARFQDASQPDDVVVWATGSPAVRLVWSYRAAVELAGRSSRVGAGPVSDVETTGVLLATWQEICEEVEAAARAHEPILDRAELDRALSAGDGELVADLAGGLDGPVEQDERGDVRFWVAGLLPEGEWQEWALAEIARLLD